MIVAIDSNVIVYAFDDDAAAKQQITRTILRKGATSGVAVPLQVLGEVFAVLTRRRRWEPAAARAVVTALLSSMPICLPSPASLERAMALCAAHTISFWDAQVVTSAAEFGCGILLSEDFQDGRRFSSEDAGRAIRIVNPFQDANRDLLEMLF